MMERRRRRSAVPSEALQLLLESVRQRSHVSSIALVDTRGAVVSGLGSARELAILGAVASDAASGDMTDACVRLTHGTDVLARPIRVPGGTVYLAALGSRVGRMSEAARSVQRILA